MAKFCACLCEGVSAQYPKLPALDLQSYRQATHTPYGNSLVQVT